MDFTDIRILQELSRDGRQSAEAIGSKLSLTGNAVLRRIRTMRESGVISGRVAMPRLDSLGLSLSVHYFENELNTPSSGLLDVIAQLPNFYFGIACLNGDILVATAESGLVSEREAFDSLQQKLPHFRHFQTFRSEENGRQLSSETDLRIMLNMLKYPDLSVTELSTSLDMPVRTVNRRLSRLLTDGALRFTIEVQLSRIDGSIPFYLLLDFDEEPTVEVQGKIMSIFGGFMIFRVPFQKRRIVLALVAGNFEHIENGMSAVAGLRGLRQSMLMFPSRYMSRQSVAEGRIAELLATYQSTRAH